MDHTDRYWSVRYILPDGNVEAKKMAWPERPTSDESALQFQKELLPETYVIASRPRGVTDIAACQLRAHGIKLIDITELGAE